MPAIGSAGLASLPRAGQTAPGAAKRPLTSPSAIERLQWGVRRGMSAILNHPWLPTRGADAISVRGFVHDVDTGKLEEVSYPGPMGSIG